jgi:hypothetical protein
MKVYVDVVKERVRLGKLSLEGQWVDFCALLAVSRCEGPDPDRYLSAEELARVGSWRHKAATSVGKDVARHLGKLARAGSGGLVHHRGRTQAWRLAVAPPAIKLLPGPDTVRAWLTARSVGDVRLDHHVGALQALVEATLELSGGAADAARKLLAASSALDRADEPVHVGDAVLEHRRIDSEARRAAAQVGERGLRRLAHHVAEHPGEDEPLAVARDERRLDEEDAVLSAPPPRPVIRRLSLVATELPLHRITSARVSPR